MPRELPKEESDTAEKIITFLDSVEVENKDETMYLVDCPYCNRRLRVSETYSSLITCGNCNKVFNRQNKQIHNNLYDNKGRVNVVTNAQRRARVTPGKMAKDAAFSVVLTTLFTIVVLFVWMMYIFAQW